ncbi:MAG: hypothetical protein LBS68_03700 [Puniceicoccales bacterium]|jgi:hypothetical protein|nr:hypothetical protein [Puniceicoccales bacterium]
MNLPISPSSESVALSPEGIHFRELNTTVSERELLIFKTLTKTSHNEGDAGKASWVQSLDFDAIPAKLRYLLLEIKEEYATMVASWKKLNEGGHLTKEEFDRMTEIATLCKHKISNVSRAYEMFVNERDAYNEFHADLMDLARGLIEIKLAKYDCFEFHLLPSESASNKSPVWARKTDATECVDKFRKQLSQTIGIAEQAVNGDDLSSAHIDDAVTEIKNAKLSYPNGSWQAKLCDEFLLLFEEVKDQHADGSYKLCDIHSDSEKVDKYRVIFRKLNMLQHLGLQKCKILFNVMGILDHVESGGEKYKCQDIPKWPINMFIFAFGFIDSLAFGIIFPPLFALFLIPLAALAIIAVRWAIDYNDRKIKEKKNNEDIALGMKRFPDPSTVEKCLMAVDKSKSPDLGTRAVQHGSVECVVSMGLKGPLDIEGDAAGTAPAEIIP